MELRHLKYFVAVAEEMNVHRAAARLNISQPPLSLTIKQLEEEIGAALFTREGRGIQITRAGEIFLVEARKILADTVQARQKARDSHDGVVGTLKIGFVSSSISGILQSSVSAYKKEYPDVVLDIVQSTNTNIPAQLMKRDIDIGILRLPESAPDTLEMKTVWKESWFAALPDKHILSKKSEIRIEDLADQRIIFYPRSNTPIGYDDVMSLFTDKGIHPHIYQEATEQMTIAGLVASGMGIGIVPECMANIKIPGVRHRPIAHTKNRTGFAFVFRKENDLLVKNFCSLQSSLK